MRVRSHSETGMVRNSENLHIPALLTRTSADCLRVAVMDKISVIRTDPPKRIDTFLHHFYGGFVLTDVTWDHTNRCLRVLGCDMASKSIGLGGSFRVTKIVEDQGGRAVLCTFKSTSTTNTAGRTGYAYNATLEKGCHCDELEEKMDRGRSYY